jgi:predicted transposase YdaD
MAFKYDIETDVAFLEGREIGEARGEQRGETRATHRFVTQMLRNQKYTLQEIADNADVSIAFVENVQKEIEADTL